MIKRNRISLLLIAVSLGVLFGYRAFDRIRTDAASPVITVAEQLLEVSVRDPRTALLTGVTARDDRDGDVTESLVVESVRLLRDDGTVTVTCAAFDRSGNVSKLTREVRYSDYVSPRFSLTQPLMFTQNTRTEIRNVITARDMLDGDISHRVRATALDQVTSGYSGTYKVKFQVTNSLGDTVELVLPVEVYTPSPNEGELILSDYLIYLKRGDSFNPGSFVERLTVGREQISLREDMPENVELTISGEVDTGEPGVYQMDYQIIYYPHPGRTEGAYTAWSRLIVVVEG